MLRNNIANSTVAIMNMTRSVGGSYINTVDVVTQYMPGNFGVRVVETMPTNLSEVYRERKTLPLGTNCLNDHARLPEMMGQPLKVDYPTDDEEDETKDFALKIPDLADIINEFEKDDDTIYKAGEALK